MDCACCKVDLSKCVLLREVNEVSSDYSNLVDSNLHIFDKNDLCEINSMFEFGLSCLNSIGVKTIFFAQLKPEAALFCLVDSTMVISDYLKEGSHFIQSNCFSVGVLPFEFISHPKIYLPQIRWNSFTDFTGFFQKKNKVRRELSKGNLSFDFDKSILINGSLLKGLS